ncbi:hypothetical protein [Niallia sp. NCCP-28]|nr:hypothetical protein [Niallia sp. NCCP-28]
MENEEMLKVYKKEIIEYLEGKRKDFIMAFDYNGTPFQLGL